MYISIIRDLSQKVKVDSEKGQRVIRNHPHSKTASREMPRTKCKSTLYMTFVELTKGFDTVSREGLWNRLSTQIRSNGAEM